MINNYNLISIQNPALKGYTCIVFSLVFILVTSILSANASVKSYKKEEDGVTFILDKGIMKVKICKEDIIEVKYTFMNSFPAKNSLVINNLWVNKPAYSISETQNEIIISTKKLKIKINKATDAISYRDLNDNIIIAES